MPISFVLMRHRRAVVLGLACLGGLLACGEERPPAQTVVAQTAPGEVPVRDTTALACTDLFRPGDSLPGRVAIAAVSHAGVIAWQPVGMPILILRQPDGQETRIAGSDGRTRFLNVARLGWVGDTLSVTDAESNRVHRFRSDGTLLGTLLAPTLGSWAVDPDGRLMTIAPRGFSAGVGDSAWALVRAQPRQPRVDTLALFPASPWREVQLPGGSALHPLSITTLAGMASNGARWCATHGTPEGMRLRCATPAGVILFDQALGVPHRVLEKGLYQQIVQQYATPEANHPDSLQAAMPPTDSLPFAFPPLLIGNDGAVWLLRSHPVEDGATWLRVDASGRVQDLLSLPEHTMPLAISADTLWLALADLAQVHRVARCTVRP